MELILGFTVTSNTKGSPLHFVVAGVITYVTTIGVVPVFSKVWLIVSCVFAADAPRIEPTGLKVGVDHVYFVSAGTIFPSTVFGSNTKVASL